MKKFLIGIVLLLGFIVTDQAFAANSVVGTTWTADDVYEVNNATPGTSKTFLGTRLYGPLVQGSTTYASGDNGNPSGGTCSDDYTTPTTTAFLKSTGASDGESYCLGDAVKPGTTDPAYNQRLTIVLTTDGGKNFNVTPNTKSGFNFVTLDDANDSVTLRYINATAGWVIDGNAGATIN